MPGAQGSQAARGVCAQLPPDVGAAPVPRERRERPERMVRNPATGDQFKKEADKQVKMTIAKALKDSVNE